MHSFLKKILFFITPVALLVIALELYVEQIPNSYTYKRSYLEHHAPTIQTLILGSSYAYDGICPAALDSAFSLANSSQCFEDDYRLLARYIADMPALQRVILPLSYSSLQMVSSSNRRAYYTIYMQLYPRWPISKYSFECFNLSLMSKKIFKHLMHSDLVQCDSLGQRLGHTLEARPLSDWQQTQQLIVNDRFLGPAAEPYVQQNIVWLQQLATLCLEHDVELCLVMMPVLDAYYQGMPPEQIALMEHTLHHLSTTHQSVRVLDFQHWGTSADFFNATHLNTSGSLRFTHHLRSLLD